MKIHLRKVDGKQAVFAEVDGTYLQLGNSESLAELPGKPLPWGKVTSRLKGRLSVQHFLEVTADKNAAEGKAHLQLPSPSDLWISIDYASWRKALELVETEADNFEAFRRFKQWWEYLRRSEVYCWECKILRKAFVDGNNELFITAFSGNLRIPSLLKSFRGFCQVANQASTFGKIWRLPLAGECFFLWPEISSAEIVAASTLSIFNNIHHMCHVLNAPPSKEDGFSLCTGFTHTPDLNNLLFFYPCDTERASVFATALFQSTFKVTQFRIQKVPPSFEEGIFFVVQMKKNNKSMEEREKDVYKLRNKILQTMSSALEIEIPMPKTWSQRNGQDSLLLRRELEAYDGDTDFDLWPESLESRAMAISRAKKRAKDKIKRLENAAEKRRQILKPSAKP